MKLCQIRKASGTSASQATSNTLAPTIGHLKSKLRALVRHKRAGESAIVTGAPLRLAPPPPRPSAGPPPQERGSVLAFLPRVHRGGGEHERQFVQDGGGTATLQSWR